jgi:hypothetical protein
MLGFLTGVCANAGSEANGATAPPSSNEAANVLNFISGSEGLMVHIERAEFQPRRGQEGIRAAT